MAMAIQHDDILRLPTNPMLRPLIRGVLPLGAVLLTSACSQTLADCACLDATRPGCAPPSNDFLLIEAQQGASLSSKPKVEVSGTPAYDTSRAASGVAAIRLPDNCLNSTAAQVAGEARETQAIAQTLCGVWLAELEKALVKAHFRVVSWDALRGLERSKNLPAYKAAEELGADVLFLFNSVEASDVAPGGKVGSKLRYFRSNERGETGDPYPLSESERAPLRASIERVMESLASPTAADKSTATATALSATLDATAVLTRSGESVWFYRNRTVKPLQAAIGRRFLFVRYMDAWHLTRRNQPPEVVMTSPVEQLSAEDSSQTTVGARHDPFASERLDLVRAVANDFVERYRSGRAGEG
jgi:hypothetical protein